MKTIKNAALFVLCLGMVAAVSAEVEAGKRKGNRGHRGHRVRYYRPVHKPVYVAPKPCAVAPAGTVIELHGYFGRYPGHIIFELGGVKLHAKVVGWTHHGIKILLPKVNLAAPATAKLLVVRWDKYVFKPRWVKVLPPLPVKAAPAPVAPAPAAPASVPAGGAVAPVSQVSVETPVSAVQPVDTANAQNVPDDLK